MRRWFCFLCCLVCLMASGYAAARPALKVGIEISDNPPFSFLNEKGEWVGFDVDLAKALCNNMNADCEFQAMSFTSLLTGLKERKLDIVVSGMSFTNERATYMDFVGPYYRTRSIYIGRPEMIEMNEETLKGKTMVAVAGYAQLKYLKRKWGSIANVQGLPSTTAAFQALIDGKADVVLVDGILSYTFLKGPAGQNFVPVGDAVNVEETQNTAYIAVQKGKPDLLEEVNRTFFQLRISGEYQRINRKYVPYSIY